MRTLVISDIHGNLAALEAVLAEPHDKVLCLGDIVGYGPQPAACLQRIRAERAIVVQGNHDHALAEGDGPQCRPGFLRLAEAVAPLSWQQLSPDELAYLAALPRWLVLDLDGWRYTLVHATPSNPLYRYLGSDPEAWAPEVRHADAESVFVGHSHVQFMLEVEGVRVVNPGSVGQPKDHEPTAAYAVIEDGEIALRRTAYPVEDTVAALEGSSLPTDVIADLAELLRTGRVPERLTV